jgi:hypothetical protein
VDDALYVRVQKLDQEIDGVPRVKRIEEYVGEAANATATAQLLQRPSSEAPLWDR